MYCLGQSFVNYMYIITCHCTTHHGTRLVCKVSALYQLQFLSYRDETEQQQQQQQQDEELQNEHFICPPLSYLRHSYPVVVKDVDSLKVILKFFKCVDSAGPAALPCLVICTAGKYFGQTCWRTRHCATTSIPSFGFHDGHIYFL